MTPNQSQPKPTLAEMAQYLKDHETYHEHHGDRHFSWNIKVYKYDETGYGSPDFKPKPEWDERWKKHVEEDELLFHTTCADGLRYLCEEGCYFEGFEKPHPLASVTGYKLYAVGRSGGHLILDELNGHKVDTDTDWKELIEEDAYWLGLVYHVCKCIGEFDPEAEMTHQYAFQRQLKEEEWDEELEAERKHKKDLKLLGTFIYLRAHPVKHSAVIDAAKRLGLPTTPEDK